MQILDLGTKCYRETLELQRQLLEKRADDLIEDTLILVEHPPVYTVGRAGLESPDERPILARVPVVEVERGGKMTFHGPGQLVGYPIFALPHHDLRRYLRDLERVLMLALAEAAALRARPCPETLLLDPGQIQTGVWVRDKKIASIGIAIKRWVAFHGFALNLTTDMRYFEAIEPCGFPGSIMTSVKRELGDDCDIETVAANVKRSLIAKFRDLSDSYRPFSLSLALRSGQATGLTAS